jgi:hypothetical protein
LIGALGDKLTGGGSADTFVFNPNLGNRRTTAKSRTQIRRPLCKIRSLRM